jgi:hypothetical protein
VARPLILALLLLALPFLAVRPVGAEEAGDVVVLPSGPRIRCEVVGWRGPFLEIRIGERTYELERAGLAIEAEGAPRLDPDWLALVEGLAPRLVHPDPALVEAARQALRSLGEAGRPYLEAVAADAGDPRVRSALLELLRDGAARPEGGGGGLAGRILERARTALGLRPDQEGGFEQAVSDYLAALRAGADRARASETMRKALEAVLTAEQLKGMEDWFGGGGR